MKVDRRLQEQVFSLYAEMDLSRLLDRIAEKIKEFLDCEAASIFIYNPQKQELYFESATGEQGRRLKQITLRLGEGIAGWIAEHGQALMIDDCARDPRWSGRTDRQVQFVTRSILGIPIAMSGSLLGVMEAINKRGGPFKPADRERLEGIAHLVAIPLQNAILFKKTLADSREKEQLLLLGKKISAAHNYNEIFSNLKQIIFDLLSPQAIRIYVKPERKLYDLISGAVEVREIADEGTQVESGRMRFPLHTGRGDLGFLEIASQSQVSETGLSLVRGLASYLAIVIEKIGLYREMVEAEKVMRELQIARDIQQSFLIPPGLQVPGLDLAYINLSSSAVGGDYYEIMPLPDGRLILSVNDISGHGVPASLLMAIFRSHFISLLRRDPDLVGALGQVNELFVETTPANQYVTSFSALADLGRGTLTYVNAGHPPPLLLRAGGCLELPSTSMVVGLMPGAPMQTGVAELRPGDLLLLYTDGVIEAENGRGEPYGLARLAAFAQKRTALPAAALQAELIADLQGFCGGAAFADDVTLIVVRVLAEN